MKKIISILLVALLALSVVVMSSCEKEPTDVRVFALKGPTGMGMAQLMELNALGQAENNYTFTIASSPDEVAAEIIKGNYDIAAVPTNLASVLYNKTEGNVRIAAVNTLGVLYILENGKTINSIEDLNGKKIYATGQASTPEYVLDYILKANNIDCEVTYLADHSELATLMVSGDVAIGMLPVPNATTVLKQSNARIALNITEEWEKAAQINGEDGALYQGCIIINPDFIEKHPDVVADFLDKYNASVNFVNNDPETASLYIENFGIIPKAAIAKAAIPNANIVCITGEEMADGLMGFFKVLFDSNPSSVGGKLPERDIFYIEK